MIVYEEKISAKSSAGYFGKLPEETSMIVALLFNWRSYEHDANYWYKIRDTVFGSNIIQNSGRHMKLSIGDVMTGFRSGQDIEALYEKAFLRSQWRLVDEDRLIEGFPTVFGMVFENMPRDLAAELDKYLLSHAGYLGALSIHLEYGPHLSLYRQRLPPQYRLQGSIVRSFYQMGEEDERDEYDLEEMKQYGYTDAEFEDSGASRTILDDFDTPRHFQRVATFRNLLTSMLAGGEDDAYELTMLLEDLSPKLFNALGAATERLAQAENEEDVAQVAISGRRYLEQLADALFPPTNIKRGNRRLDKPSYKNRLWAFVEDETKEFPKKLPEIGKRIDCIVDEFNVGLHGEMTKERVATALVDAAQLTATLFALNPKASRNGYLAYQKSLKSFVEDLFRIKPPRGI